MFANRYKINLSMLLSGTTATTIDIPINLEYQIVDQAELVERVFVDTEVQEAINPILDYEKARFTPTDLNGNNLFEVIYNLNFFLSGTTTLGATNYASIGYSDSDIEFEKNNFTESFLTLSFYDTDTPLDQHLISFITIFSELGSDDLLPDNATQISQYGYVIGIPGQPKPAHLIPLQFVVSSGILNPNGFSEGYNLYDYKSDLEIGQSKYLYMRATFNNAKTGKSTNLMVAGTAYPIDELIHQLYTRYILYRTSTGYYYKLDTTYHGDGTSGPNNVNYSTNQVEINLYQINAL